MDYPDIPVNKAAPQEVVIRKALQPLVKQYITDELLQGLATTKADLSTEISKVDATATAATGSLAKDIAKVATSVADVALKVKTLKNTDLGDIIKRVDDVIATNIQTTDTLQKLSADNQAELTKAFQLIFAQLVKAQPKLTDKADPTDYLNVRLTDGEDFYRAIDKYVTAISDGGTIPFQDATGKAARPTVTNNKLDVNATVVPPYYALRVDDYSTAGVKYIGNAVPGSAESAAVWQVQKIDQTTGTVITWANGDSNFTNIWANRLTLTYS